MCSFIIKHVSVSVTLSDTFLPEVKTPFLTRRKETVEVGKVLGRIEPGTSCTVGRTTHSVPRKEDVLLTLVQGCTLLSDAVLLPCTCVMRSETDFVLP